MATGGDRSLTPSEIAELAAAISSTSMETIANRYLGLKPETLVSLRDEQRGNIEAFNRDIIQRWANMNSGADQRQVRVNNSVCVSRQLLNARLYCRCHLLTE